MSNETLSERPSDTGRRCAVCGAGVAAWPTAMGCHCWEIPWEDLSHTPAESGAGADVEALRQENAELVAELDLSTQQIMRLTKLLEKARAALASSPTEQMREDG